MKNKIGKWLLDYGVILFGCAAYALSFHFFFDANAFAMGGFTGIAQILNRITGGLLPVGTVVWAMNLPLILLGVRKQGMRLLFATLFAITVSSTIIDALAILWPVGPMGDPLLACVFGSALLGVALGMLMNRGATTGGTELLARLLKYKFRHLSIGRLCLIIDVVVVSLYALVFREVYSALYGLLGMYIASRVMDTVIYGSVNAKLAMIISDNSQQIMQRLLDMELGVTVLNGRGAFTNTPKEVILCVFKRQHIASIKAVATELDPRVFFIVCEAREVLGEGFGEYSEHSL